MSGLAGVGRGCLLALAWLVLTGAVVGDRAARRAEEGREAYRRGDFAAAVRLYRDAQIEKPDSPQLHYNVGSALFKSGDVETAARELEQAAAGGDRRLRARALYNMGNALLARQELESAVAAYRGALAHDPYDRDAKANLELALRRLERQQRQQNRQQDQGQGARQQQEAQAGGADQQRRADGEPRDRQQPRSGDQQDMQPEDEQQPQPPAGPAEESRDAPPPMAGRMDRREAERLLDALRDRERQALMRRLRPPAGHRGNDW